MDRIGEGDERMSTGIYTIRCKPTGKLYVGSAINVAARWRIHRHALRHGAHHSSHLQRAWDKYGAASFEFSIVEQVADAAQLVAREQHYLDELKGFEDGYNNRPTAASNLGTKRPFRARGPMSPVSRARMSVSAKLRKATVETRQLLQRLRRKDIAGRIFGRLTVLSFVRSDGKGTTFWRCRCSCGGEVQEIRKTMLLSGDKKSCGCLPRGPRVAQEVAHAG